ncbi:MAG: ZIP family metal transporter [Patescibacteria group bacterium]
MLIFYILGSALLIMIASLIGVIFVWKGFGAFMQKNSHYLTTFSGGVFAVLAFTMSKETLHLSQHDIILTTASILAGIIIIEIITRLMPDAHHHHTLPPDCDKKHSCIDARRMMISDAFHNVGDGILIVSAYLIDVRVGITATIGIFLHEIVQEISEFFVFKEANYSTKKALQYNFMISSSILAGVMIALALSSFELLIAPLMGLAAGGFIYVLAKDLIPHSLHNAKKMNSLPKHLLVFLCGITIMVLANNIIPHSHEHEEDEHEHTTIEPLPTESEHNHDEH